MLTKCFFSSTVAAAAAEQEEEELELAAEEEEAVCATLHVLTCAANLSKTNPSGQSFH